MTVCTRIVASHARVAPASASTYSMLLAARLSGLRHFVRVAFLGVESEVSDSESEVRGLESAVREVASEILAIESEVADIESVVLREESEISNPESEVLTIESKIPSDSPENYIL